jgi:hypothetical protein
MIMVMLMRRTILVMLITLIIITVMILEGGEGEGFIGNFDIFGSSNINSHRNI